jgi:hypothetical protein
MIAFFIFRKFVRESLFVIPNGDFSTKQKNRCEESLDDWQTLTRNKLSGYSSHRFFALCEKKLRSE